MTVAQDDADSLIAALDARIRAIVAEEIGKYTPAIREWLTAKEAMEQTGLSEWTIRKMARQGLVEFYQPNPGKPPLRISRRSLFDVLSEGAKKGNKK